MCRRTEELATLNEELAEQTRMALDAQRAAESASTQLAQAQQRQAAAEQQAAKLEERLAAELAAREEADRSAKHRCSDWPGSYQGRQYSLLVC